jgi:hypothetical protein
VSASGSGQHRGRIAGAAYPSARIRARAASSTASPELRAERRTPRDLRDPRAAALDRLGLGGRAVLLLEGIPFGEKSSEPGLAISFECASDHPTIGLQP